MRGIVEYHRASQGKLVDEDYKRAVRRCEDENIIAGMIASIALITIGVYTLLHSLDAPVSEQRTLIGGADDYESSKN